MAAFIDLQVSKCNTAKSSQIAKHRDLREPTNRPSRRNCISYLKVNRRERGTRCRALAAPLENVPFPRCRGPGVRQPALEEPALVVSGRRRFYGPIRGI